MLHSHFISMIVEFMFSSALFVNAVLFIPQILSILRSKNVTGLSLITFGGFNLIQLATVLHGFLTGDRLLAYGYILSFITCGAVTVCIIYYRSRISAVIEEL